MLPWHEDSGVSYGEEKVVDASKAFLASERIPSTWSHGNHAGRLKRTVLTDLVLIHYHKRSSAQLMKKTLNAWTGKGYPTDVATLRLDEKTGQPFKGYDGGNHNTPTVIQILTGVLPKGAQRVPVQAAHRRIDLIAFAARLRGAASQLERVWSAVGAARVPAAALAALAAACDAIIEVALGPRGVPAAEELLPLVAL